jgi:hypothetical protein
VLGTRQVVVDVAGVRFWDLSGLYALTDFTADLAAFGRSCRVVGAPAGTRRLIGLAALGDALNLDGPLRELPPSSTARPAVPSVRRPVSERPARPRGAGELVPAGGPAAPEHGMWRRRDR